MGASFKKCCCCCKDKKEEQTPLLDEELAIGDEKVKTDTLLAKSLARHRHETVRRTPDVDPKLTPVEQAVARYNIRSERQEVH